MKQVADREVLVLYDRLFTKYYPGLCVYAETFVTDALTAEDLVQDVFVNVWLKRRELTLDDSLGPYLYQSVRNAGIQQLRRRQVAEDYRTQARLTEESLIPAAWIQMALDPAEKDEVTVLYRQALEELPEKTRHIFRLSREQGLTNAAIADRTGLTVKTVEYHITRALKVFRTAFKDYIRVWILLHL